MARVTAMSADIPTFATLDVIYLPTQRKMVAIMLV
jgi:hypothetical protein